MLVGEGEEGEVQVEGIGQGVQPPGGEEEEEAGQLPVELEQEHHSQRDQPDLQLPPEEEQIRAPR